MKKKKPSYKKLKKAFLAVVNNSNLDSEKCAEYALVLKIWERLKKEQKKKQDNEPLLPVCD